MTDVQFHKNDFDFKNPTQWRITIDDKIYKSQNSPNYVETIGFICGTFNVQPYEVDHNGNLIINPRTCYEFTKLVLGRAANQTPTETTLKRVMTIVFDVILNRTGKIPIAIDKYCMNDFFTGYADALHLILGYYKHRKTDKVEIIGQNLTDFAEAIFRVIGTFTPSKDDPIVRRMLNSFFLCLFKGQKDFLFDVYRISNSMETNISSDGKMQTKYILDNYFKHLQRSDNYKNQDPDTIDIISTWLELKIVE
jgi:hypothetical protein